MPARPPSIPTVLLPILLALTGALAAPGQDLASDPSVGLGPRGIGGTPDPDGTFVNFETPQVKPITVATVGTGRHAHEWLVVCNTPDDSIEIYDAHPPFAFADRVPVGRGPVTVRWNATLQRLFVCNFDGDSISIVRLQPLPGLGVPSVGATLVRTTVVGDEPADLSFSPDGLTCIVTLSSRSGVVFLATSDLSIASGPTFITAPNPASPIPLGVKMPRQIEALPDGRTYTLNFMGDVDQGVAPIRAYDVDVYGVDPLASPNVVFTGGLGSTNHAMAISAAGDRMFVVGTRAEHRAAAGVQAVAALPTGFVRSFLWAVDLTPGQAPAPRGEAPPAVVPAPPLPSINLNRDYTRPGLAEITAFGDALSQPTDLVLIESEAPPFTLSKIVLAAYHSDRLAFLVPDVNTAGGWRISRLDLPVLDPGAGYSVSGPRGLAFSRVPTDPATPASPGLVYCLCRNDDTVAVVNPTSETVVARFPLRNDPTPPIVRAGRQFLYGARNSGKGFVACASCHVDARTDGLTWDLGSLDPGPAIPPWFHDGNGFDVLTMPAFPDEKGPITTQTLQGLVNHPVRGPTQALFTNAPYHWRGDKPAFTDFNEAFVNLQGMPDAGSPGDPKGLSDADMKLYERYINTVRHPPNPEQALDRRLVGTIGADPNDVTAASADKLGLVLFHDVQSVDVRSCVDCHSLPDGSSNTSTLTFDVDETLSTGSPKPQPFESAALRNLGQREMTLHDDFSAGIDAIVSSFGLLHPGDPFFLSGMSINGFVHIFETAMPGPTQADRTAQIEALVGFIRRFDTGVAPAAGYAYTVDPATPLLNAVTFDLLEGQVREANIGLAVHTRSAGVERGFWFDVTADPPAYREVGGPGLLGRASLEALAAGPDDVVVLQGTPLGSERRAASPTGRHVPILDPTRAPSGLTLLPMAPSTPWVDVAGLTGNLHQNPAPATSIWSRKVLQESVVGPTYGIETRRHQPPRRFRVAGRNVRPGARLLLGMAAGAQPASFPVVAIEMDLYPTAYRTAGGRRIWETSQEMAPMMTLAMLNGGIFAPDVVNVLLRTTTAPALAPAAWNRFLVTVVNEDGSVGTAAGWQVLRVQDTR